MELNRCHCSRLADSRPHPSHPERSPYSTVDSEGVARQASVSNGSNVVVEWERELVGWEARAQTSAPPALRLPPLARISLKTCPRPSLRCAWSLRRGVSPEIRRCAPTTYSPTLSVARLCFHVSLQREFSSPSCNATSMALFGTSSLTTISLASCEQGHKISEHVPVAVPAAILAVPIF